MLLKSNILGCHVNIVFNLIITIKLSAFNSYVWSNMFLCGCACVLEPNGSSFVLKGHLDTPPIVQTLFPLILANASGCHLIGCQSSHSLTFSLLYNLNPNYNHLSISPPPSLCRSWNHMNPIASVAHFLLFNLILPLGVLQFGFSIWSSIWSRVILHWFYHWYSYLF